MNDEGPAPEHGATSPTRREEVVGMDVTTQPHHLWLKAMTDVPPGMLLLLRHDGSADPDAVRGVIEEVRRVCGHDQFVVLVTDAASMWDIKIAGEMHRQLGEFLARVEGTVAGGADAP